MIRWIPYTFIRTVLFFTAGILLGIYLPDFLPQVYILGFLLALVILYFGLFLLRRYFDISVVSFGFIAFPAILIAGYIHLLQQTEIRSLQHLSNLNTTINSYRVILDSYAEEKDRSWKIVGEITHIKNVDWHKAEGKVILYFQKKDFTTTFNYGDVLLIRGSPQSIPPPSNPGEFDYRRFLTFRNIYLTHFIRQNDVAFIKRDPQNIFKAYAIQARLWANAVLHQYVSGKQEQAIASALVLGVTDGLDNELLNAYAATGALHVLSVSGLHISIIYLIILLACKPLAKKRAGKWIIAFISIFILWAYAFITGLSPSVLRAVTMFTFIAVARATSRNTNIYNTLAASAFCLLVYDPYLIMSVGFQLSYLAVLGIVYIQPLIYNQLEARTWFMDQVWKITCVSIAAQLATFALGLLYFHQFPNYFLLSNLLVIPVSFAVLVGGLVLLAVSFINVVAGVVGFLLTVLIKALNLVVLTVDLFPFSLIEGIHMTTFQCWLLMAIIICVVLMIQYKKFKYFIIASCLVFVYSILQWQHFIENDAIDKITVYKVPGHSAFDFISQGKAYFVADSALQLNNEKIRFHIRPNRLHAGVNKVINNPNHSFLKQLQGCSYLVWHGKTILHITSTKFSLQELVNVDVVIIGNNAVKNLEIFRTNLQAEKIVFDSSNSFSYAERMIKNAALLNLNIHSVLQQGAFQVIIDSDT